MRLCLFFYFVSLGTGSTKGDIYTWIVVVIPKAKKMIITQLFSFLLTHACTFQSFTRSQNCSNYFQKPTYIQPMNSKNHVSIYNYFLEPWLLHRQKFQIQQFLFSLDLFSSIFKHNQIVRWGKQMSPSFFSPLHVCFAFKRGSWCIYKFGHHLLNVTFNLCHCFCARIQPIQ